MSILSRPTSYLLSLAVFALGATTGAQTVQTSSTSLPLATASSLVGSINIDGKLDEPAWAKATPITDFRQQQPREGAPASQRTEVRILYDERAIYIGARMYDSLGRRGIRAPSLSAFIVVFSIGSPMRPRAKALYSPGAARATERSYPAPDAPGTDR